MKISTAKFKRMIKEELFYREFYRKAAAERDHPRNKKKTSDKSKSDK